MPNCLCHIPIRPQRNPREERNKKKAIYAEAVLGYLKIKIKRLFVLIGKVHTLAQKGLSSQMHACCMVRKSVATPKMRSVSSDDSIFSSDAPSILSKVSTASTYTVYETPQLNPNSGKMSTSYSEFSEVHFQDPTNEYAQRAEKMTPARLAGYPAHHSHLRPYIQAAHRGKAARTPLAADPRVGQPTHRVQHRLPATHHVLTRRVAAASRAFRRWWRHGRSCQCSAAVAHSWLRCRCAAPRFPSHTDTCGHGVEEPSLNPSLMEYHLLKSTDAWNRVGYTITQTDGAILIRIPESNLEHMVALLPSPLSEAQTVEDF